MASSPASTKASRRTLRAASRKYPGVYERVVNGRGTRRFAAAYYDPAVRGKAWVRGGPWLTPRDAAMARTARLAAVHGGARIRATATIREYYDSVYRPWYDVKNKPGSAATSHYALRPFLTRFGTQRLNNFDEDAVRRWGLDCPLNHAKAARAFLYRAKDERLLRDNPLARLGRSEGPGRANIDIISEQELVALADTAVDALGDDYGPVFRAHILFSAYTTMRPGEVRPLRKTNVLNDYVQVRESVSGGVVVSTPKNGLWRTILLPPPARRALDTMLVDPANPYVFRAKRGQRMSKATQYRYWNATRKAHAEKTGDPSWLDKDFYEVTRHFGAWFLLNVLRQPAEIVAYQLGHTGQTGVDLVLRLYGHPDHARWRASMLRSWQDYEDGGSGQ